MDRDVNDTRESVGSTPSVPFGGSSSVGSVVLTPEDYKVKVPIRLVGVRWKDT